MTTLSSVMVVTTTHIANFIMLVVVPFVGKDFNRLIARNNPVLRDIP